MGTLWDDFHTVPIDQSYGLFCSYSWEGGGWWEGSTPEVRSLTLLYAIFCRKDTPFIYLPLTNGTPFIYLVLENSTLSQIN